jgi:hypothetical protein
MGVYIFVTVSCTYDLPSSRAGNDSSLPIKDCSRIVLPFTNSCVHSEVESSLVGRTSMVNAGDFDTCYIKVAD